MEENMADPSKPDTGKGGVKAPFPAKDERFQAHVKTAAAWQ
jgi:hypothetical protein